ncbi:Uncharacterised protein [Vibrio cholerae]|nr:Uncharacterised protein [Vibrio cholerae]
MLRLQALKRYLSQAIYSSISLLGCLFCLFSSSLRPRES